MTPIKILIVEDSPDDAELVLHELRRSGFEPVWQRVETAWDFLAGIKDLPDIILSDYSLPQFSGMKALQLLKESGLEIPFILISGTLGEEKAVEAMKHGATDYVLKDRLARLGPALTQALENKLLREEHGRIKQQLLLQATALETAANAILITDRAGKILWVNPSFVELTGYAAEEIQGKSPRILKSGAHDAAFYHDFWDTITQGKTWRGEFTNRRKDGTHYFAENTVTPVRDAGGKITHFVGIMDDMTDRKMLEEDFRQSQKLESIGQLAGGVAHDFNNILAVILMQAELSIMVKDTPREVKDGLTEIVAAADRAANLTRQLLQFSRKQVMQLRQLDLNEVVTSLAKMLRRIIREDVSLELHLHSGALPTHADAGMLDQVLMNLAVNARDAMPGGGRLIIETSEKMIDTGQASLNPEAAAGRYVWLSVSDTGCGMSPEIQSRIFEPFYTTKEAGKGTGLGLATVFGIIKQHRGWLKVYSEGGKGTTFQIFLPASEASTDCAEGDKQQAELAGGSETILVVEDDASVRMLTCTALERNGYKILEAANSHEAQRVWRQHEKGIALLLTDLVMPGGMDGLELAAAIQARNPDLRVIFTSGYSAEIAGSDLPLRPGQSYIQKPCPTQQLLAAVRNCLDS